MAVTKIVRNAIQCMKCDGKPGFSIKQGDDENVSIKEKRKCDCGQTGVFGGFQFLGRIWPEGKDPNDWFMDLSQSIEEKDEDELEAEIKERFNQVFPGREPGVWYLADDHPPVGYQVIATVGEGYLSAVYFSKKYGCWVDIVYNEECDDEDEQERENDRFMDLEVSYWMIPVHPKGMGLVIRVGD